MRKIGAALVLSSIFAFGCGDPDLKALGVECVASAECQEGLTCDFGRAPPTCQEGQTPIIDGAPPPVIDAPITIEQDAN